MAIVIYPAIVEHAGDGFSVFFPDLPGCVSAGATIQQAALNAEEALAGHLLVSAHHGDVLADPTSLDALVTDPEMVSSCPTVLLCPLPVSEPSDPAVIFSVPDWGYALLNVPM